jgi:tRNA nucleotidyltransferase/poly(A) polymerase
MEPASKIRTILVQLEENGHEAYIVGGAVRDMLLGNGYKPKDWDIATSANPGQIKETFAYLKPEHVKQIDASFPVVLVAGVEIATYRQDFYDVGVTTGTKKVKTIEEDLSRRDLTINAMAMDKDLNVIDPFDGQKDLEKGIIRFVGDPAQRIYEDPCRIIRACRFLAAIGGGFEIEAFIALKNAVQYGKYNVPPERVRLEILKAMQYEHASKFFIALHDIRLLKTIFPALDKCYGANHGQYHDENIFDHMMIAGDAIPTSEQPLLRLTGYLHDVGKSQPNFKIGKKGDDEIHFYEHEAIGADVLREELKDLKFSIAEIKYITNLVLTHMRGGTKMSPKSTRKLIRRFTELDVDWKHWLILKTADRIGNIRKIIEGQPLKVEKIAKKFEHELEGIPYEKGPSDPNGPAPCFEHKQLAISGTQIQKVLGIGPSQLIGVILEYLLKRVIDDPSLNTNKQLVALIFGKLGKKKDDLNAENDVLIKENTKDMIQPENPWPRERTMSGIQLPTKEEEYKPWPNLSPK